MDIKKEKEIMEDIIKKIEAEKDATLKHSDELSTMEENEEFMDGEMIYQSGFAWGRFTGLRYALKILKEGNYE